MYGALRIRDGKDLTRCAASRNSKGYIALLADSETDNPTGDIFLITDNLTSHLSVETNTWLAQHPRIYQIFIPKGARLCFICKRAGGVSSAAMRVATGQLNARAKPWIWGRPPRPPRRRRHLFCYRI